MKKNKKSAFTLIELLAVILLMGVLTILIVPSIINIRNNALEKSYQSKLADIKNAALDWAYDNKEKIMTDGSCYDITVGLLINGKYLFGDTETSNTLTDPRDKSSMNNLKICVKSFRKQVNNSNINETVLVYEAVLYEAE